MLSTNTGIYICSDYPRIFPVPHPLVSSQRNYNLIIFPMKYSAPGYLYYKIYPINFSALLFTSKTSFFMFFRSQKCLSTMLCSAQGETHADERQKAKPDTTHVKRCIYTTKHKLYHNHHLVRTSDLSRSTYLHEGLLVTEHNFNYEKKITSYHMGTRKFFKQECTS
jgi:hypothetical protein